MDAAAASGETRAGEIRPTSARGGGPVSVQRRLHTPLNVPGSSGIQAISVSGRLPRRSRPAGRPGPTLAYAVLDGTEAVGLWLGRRWAEYLTFVATVVFVPYEVYELTKSVSALKILALVINLAIVAYLLFAKRLFGLRGGGKAERAEHEEDTGWAPVERATPVPVARGDGSADYGSRPAQPEPSGANRPPG